VVGVFVPEDPKAADELSKHGRVAFEWRLLWAKGHSVGTGQANVKAYNRRLRDLIATGKAQPSFIVSHQVPLDEGPDAYRHFDDRDEGWTKIIFEPAA
jgi:glutathione-independent formaldehyde dehydrogenase